MPCLNVTFEMDTTIDCTTPLGVEMTGWMKMSFDLHNWESEVDVDIPIKNENVTISSVGGRRQLNRMCRCLVRVSILR